MALTVGTNSYVDVATADTYFADRLYSTSWTGATSADKASALIMATKKLDRQQMCGVKAVDSQTLQFPRALYSYAFIGNNNIVGVNVRNAPGWVIETAVSQSVKDATCEEAISILSHGANAAKRVELQRQGVTSFSLGGLSESYSSASDGQKLLSSEAAQLMRPYLAGGRVIV